ncbi:MAG: hypothetical protein LBK42_00540 [Propionibacteriaceae bacterium]|nr:hypothetical protein [Propionibacteriaceae bacterium]
MLYLLYLAHGSARRLIGLDAIRLGRDLLAGFGLLAAIGLPGLGFYLVARQLGLNTTVAAANLGEAWWTAGVRVPERPGCELPNGRRFGGCPSLVRSAGRLIAGGQL